MQTVEQRFWKYVEPIPEGSGCWEWCGYIEASGYGGFSVKYNGKYRMERAHRISWLLNRGAIPDGLHVLHKCDNRSCINPNHLFVGSNADNISDMLAKGRHGHRARTDTSKPCPSGHVNQYTFGMSRGKMRARCMECDRISARRYQRERNATSSERLTTSPSVG